jgi:FkbM family methyltransferase
MMFYVARLWAYIYGLVKDVCGLNLRGLGFVLRLVRTDKVISVRGRKLYFNHKIAGSYGRSLAGSWNEPETHQLLSFLLSHLRGSVVFVDVGANIGEIVVDVARHENISLILAFEPIAECCKTIKRSLDLNGFHAYRIIEKLVGANVGQHAFTLNAQAPQLSSVSDVPSASSTQVSMTTLDAEALPRSDHVILLVDVEGYEPSVLRGAAGFVADRKPCIIFEYNMISKQRYKIGEIAEILGPQYEFYRLRRDGHLDDEVESAWNCVAVHRESAFSALVSSILIQSPSRTSAPPRTEA